MKKDTNINFNISTLQKSGLSTDEFFILMLLEQRHFKLRELEKLLNVSSRTIIRCFKNLKRDSFIKKKGREYILTDKLTEII